MELNAKTKIDDLLKLFPFLEDFLITLSPKFKGLRNPIMRKTMGKVASLEMAATVSGLNIDRLISSLTAEIKKQSGSASQTEPLTDPKERRAALKAIIKDLHAGGHYRGCLEVSQDLTEIRQLEGENRLLDWE